MTNLNDIFKNDFDKENDGVEYPFEDTDIVMTIARAGGTNIGYKKALGDFLKPHVNATNNEFNLTARQDFELMSAVYARSIIKDWKNVKVDGKVIKFSEKNCLMVLRKFPELFYQITGIAADTKLFTADAVKLSKTIAKKS